MTPNISITPVKKTAQKDNLQSNGKRRPKIGLVLSGAVMRGPAHIGVLTVLEREGIPIDCLAGASAGSLIGGLYCAGVGVEELTDRAARTGWNTVSSPVFPRKGFVSLAKMQDWLRGLIGDMYFSDLKIPFAISVTDLEAGQPVIFTEGRIAPLIQASCSVPGFITPVEMDGRHFGDGGVSYNLPAGAVRDLGADYVIGVDLFIPILRPKFGPLAYGLAAIETMVRQSGGGGAMCDCLISPDVAGRSYFNPRYYKELIELGKKATEEKLPEIQAVLASG